MESASNVDRQRDDVYYDYEAVCPRCGNTWPISRLTASAVNVPGEYGVPCPGAFCAGELQNAKSRKTDR